MHAAFARAHRPAEMCSATGVCFRASALPCSSSHPSHPSLFFSLSISAADTDLDPSLHLAAANNVLLHLAKLQRDAEVEPCACDPPPAHGQQHGGGEHAHPHAHAHTPDPASSATPPTPVVETDDCDVEVSRALAETAKRIHWWKLMA